MCTASQFRERGSLNGFDGRHIYQDSLDWQAPIFCRNTAFSPASDIDSILFFDHSHFRPYVLLGLLHHLTRTDALSSSVPGFILLGSHTIETQAPLSSLHPPFRQILFPCTLDSSRNRRKSSLHDYRGRPRPS